MSKLKNKNNPPIVDTCVIDDATLGIKKKQSKIHGNYCENVTTTDKIKTSGAGIKRVDFVFDICQESFSKREKRQVRERC